MPFYIRSIHPESSWYGDSRVEGKKLPDNFMIDDEPFNNKWLSIECEKFNGINWFYCAAVELQWEDY